tara:strand:- start:780 stop:923 length:144 start_codon:yes stop_codon:yes gene_type:complete
MPNNRFLEPPRDVLNIIKIRRKNNKLEKVKKKPPIFVFMNNKRKKGV